MPTLSLCLCLLFSGWLLVRDCRRRRSVSAAIWIPTLLVLILGSRSVSLWISSGSGFSRELGNDGPVSAYDEIFFASVLLGSLLVDQARGVKWSRFFTANTAIVLFYLYFAASILWSGYPVGSLKRLGKDFGLLFTIAVIFSESSPLLAMRAVYVRAASVLLPLSVVFVKYFPQYSRVYAINGDIMITGVTTQKNTLGELVLITMLFLLWDFLEERKAGAKLKWSRIPWDRVALLAMGAWLLKLSQSKTALMCLLIGSVLLLRKGWLASRYVNRIVLAGAVSLPFLLFFSREFASVIAPLVQALGRDMTFTGRANIWDHVNLHTVNPFIGAGYWNFWGGPGGLAISQEMNTPIPNAHDGYLDLYIDGGFIGLAFLFGMLISCGRRIAKRLSGRDSAVDRYMKMRFAIVVVAIAYNLSESTFSRMGLMWFTALLMLVDFPASALPARRRVARPAVEKAVVHHERVPVNG